ncbi:MAG: MOSC domain-containing protein [Chthoniobacteraceae bacterium]
MNGKRIRIVHLYISPAHNFFGHHEKPPGDSPTLEVKEVHCVAGSGIEGDRFFNFKEDYKGQITFFELEVYDRLCRELGTDAPPSVLRRNAITCGVDLNTLVGKKFEIQGVQFEGVAECKPCYWMNTAFAPGAEDSMQGHGGLRARILTTGVLNVDDPDSP